MSIDIGRWIMGRLTSTDRVLSALAPAVLLLAYFGVAWCAYRVRNRRLGKFHDEEMDARAHGGLSHHGLRHFFAWTMRPWWKLLVAVQFPPNVITLLSIALALGAGVAVAAGRFALGGWLFVTAGGLDFLDGRVARVTGRATAGGAALDSVLDRYVESALIVGLSWYYRHDWVLAACLLALTGSLLVPYIRARAEALGVSLQDVGFMQRPERIVLLGGSTALSPVLEVLLAPTDPHPPHRLAVVALVLLGVTAHITALQRLLGLLRALRASVSRLRVRRPVKSILANVLATLADFCLVAMLHFVWQTRPAVATAVGCLLGALVSFTVSRSWVFEGTRATLVHQVGRYAFVSATTAALNVGGVSLVLLLPVPFVVAWALTRAVVFVTWSYPLYKDFVFTDLQAPTSAQVMSES